jgi:hypothetical protein
VPHRCTGRPVGGLSVALGFVPTVAYYAHYTTVGEVAALSRRIHVQTKMARTSENRQLQIYMAVKLDL